MKVHLGNHFSFFSITKTCVLVALMFFLPNFVQAARLQIAPATSQVTVGNIVSVRVLVNTEGKSINNADGIVRFPTDLLEVVSINKAASIFSLWVEEPKFSNFEGKITFNGGAPNPGFTGSAGEIVSIVFRTKKSGSASIVFADSAVRQNDGLGTDVLVGSQQAVIQISTVQNVETPATPPVTSLKTPSQPIIVSATHPKQDSWYRESTATFSWNIPSDITSIQTLLNKESRSVPTIPYDSSVSQRTVIGISDGISYFHVRYMNASGWGETAHYKVQIDTTPPTNLNPSVSIKDALNILSLNATDAVSGIDRYVLVIDDNKPLVVTSGQIVNNSYVLPVLSEGEHRISVSAYDKAGNSKEASTSFVSPKIISPTITVAPREVQRGDMVTISGDTKYPNSRVDVTIELRNKKSLQYSITTDSLGKYSIETDELEVSGTARIHSQLVFENNLKSEISEVVSLQISDSKIVQTSKSAIYTLAFVIPLVALLIALAILMYVGWHKFFGLKRRMEDEVEETAKNIHQALAMFKDELGNQLDKLEKLKGDRELNKREEKIFEQLQSNIDDIDTFIKKQLRKIK